MTVPRELVSPVREAEPVIPDTVHTPVTDTDATMAPLAFTTVTVTEPLMPLLLTRLVIASEPTFTVERAVTVSVSAADAVRPPASDTLTVIGNVPPAVGVPEIVPLVESASPPGSEPPVSAHVFVPDPPVETSTVEYAVPCVAAGRVAVETASGATTTIVSERVAERVGVPLSTAVTDTTAVPAAAGVPLTTPVPASIPRPTGRPVADQVKTPVPPVAAIAALYTEPTVPSGIEAVVIETGFTATKVSAWSAVRDAASVTRTVNDVEPADDTVPDSTPPALSVAPDGSEPDTTDHVFVPDPPALASVNENAEPTVTEFSDDVVTDSTGDTTSDSDRDDERTGVPLSVAVKVTVVVAAALGIPESTPSADSVSPAGTLVADHAYVPLPPVAASVVLSAMPTVPAGRLEVAMLSGATTDSVSA